MPTTRLHIRSIVCPTDFSEASARALRHAARLSQRFGARLVVVHVIPFSASGAGGPDFPALPVVANEMLRKQAGEQLHGFVAELRDAGREPVLELRDGQPWREIVDVAQKADAGLLVMGTHGRGAFERMLLGSVTEAVLHHAACPVLTVPPVDVVRTASRILCATDLSKASARTIDYALSLAAETQSPLTLLHVLENSAPDGARQWAAQQLERAVPDHVRRWFEVDERILTGHPSARILDLAAAQRADLIVVGGHGGSAFRAGLFGSNALEVVRRAHCPVLSVREGSGSAAAAA